jgi:lipoprotein-anchoring transpeptidase ErfK/SrfK
MLLLPVQECHTDHEHRRDGPRVTCVGAFRSRISCRVSRQLGPRVMDKRTSIALLPALVVGIIIAAGPAFAQAGWSGSTPVFESDARRTAEQAEAEREARRTSYGPVVYPKYMDGGERPDIKAAEPPIVYFDQDEEVGSILIDTQDRKLYYVLPGKRAYQYPISVGRDGFTWSGSERISRIVAWPSWTPPAEMRRRQPGLPITVTGGLKNPQGARALYLGNTVYRIHGTNNDLTVGRANSSGCFRMTNEHVVHLASIAKVGAKVRVLQTYAGGVSETAPLSSLFSFLGSEPAKPAARPKAARPAVKKAAPGVGKAAPPPPTASPPPPPTEAKAASSAEATKGAQ